MEKKLENNFRVRKSNLSIKRLDNFFKPHFDVEAPLPNTCHTSLFIGSKGTGKSTLLLNLLLQNSMYNKKFDNIYIFSKTIKLDAKFKKVRLDSRKIFTTFDEESLSNILMSVSESIEKVKKENDEKPPSEREDLPLTLIIFDDMISDCATFNNSRGIMSTLYFNARHYRLSIWVSAQKMTGCIPTALRENVDCIFLYRLPNRRNLKIVWEEFASDIAFDDFYDMYSVSTEGKGNFFFINLTLPKKSGKYNSNFNSFILD